MNAKKDNQISLLVDPELKKRVMVYLAKHGLTMTGVITSHLENIIKLRGKNVIKQ